MQLRLILICISLQLFQSFRHNYLTHNYKKIQLQLSNHPKYENNKSSFRIRSDDSGTMLHSQPPKCEDCVYYEPVKIDLFGREYIQGKCLKSGRTSMYEELIQQNVTYEYAKICRRPNGLCGPEGAYFIKKID